MRSSLAATLFCFAIGATGFAQSSEPSTTTPFDNSRWRLLKQSKATFDPRAGAAEILLLESTSPTGTDGIGNPMHDVNVLILQQGKMIYDYTKRRHDEDPGLRMDNYLEIRDVTNDSNT